MVEKVFREKLFNDFVDGISGMTPVTVSYNSGEGTLRDATTGLEISLLPDDPTELDIMRDEFAKGVAGKLRPATIIFNIETRTLERISNSPSKTSKR